MYFHKAPPSTLMTGTTTQIMMDVADLLRAAALIHAYAGMPVFVLPPIVTALVLWLHLNGKPEAVMTAA